MLPPLPDSLDDGAKMDLLREALARTAQLAVNLPTFQIGDSPTVAYLLGTYSSSSSTGGGGLDFSAAGTAAWQQHSGAGTAEQPVQQMSVSDAFGSLPEVEDRPLPPLPPVATAVDPEEDGVAGGDDEFGNFDSGGADEFGIGGVGEFDSSGRDSKTYEPAVEEFGDFGGTNTDQPVAAEFGAGAVIGQFDSIQLGAQPAVEEFGDFGTSNNGQPAAIGGLPSQDVSLGTDTAQDIIGGIGEQQQQITQHTDPDIGGSETVAVELAADHVAEVEFGNFGGSPVVSLDDPDTAPAFSVAGTISSPSNSQIGVGQVLSDAFGEIEDAPLPPLSALTSAVAVESDEVDFGISTKPDSTVPKEGGLSNDGIGHFGVAEQPDLEPPEDGTKETALPDVTGDTPAPSEDDAGAVPRSEGHDEKCVEVRHEDNKTEDLHDQTEEANNDLSVFDALAPVDAPLPLMSDMASVVPRVTEADTIITKSSEEGVLGKIAEDSSFSQFKAEDSVPEKNAPEKLSAFDSLGVHDAPLPSLDDFASKDGQYGGFLSFGNAPATAVEQDAISDAAGDADDDFHGFTSFSGTPPADTQLQQVDSDSKDGQSGGFLSFGNAPVADVEQDAISDAAGDADDDFHGFTSFSGTPPADTQLQQVDSDSKDGQSGGFLSFGNAPVADVEQDAISDAAGDADDDFHGFTSFSGTSNDNSAGDFGVIDSSPLPTQVTEGFDSFSEQKEGAPPNCQTKQVVKDIGVEFGMNSSSVGESSNQTSQGQICDTKVDGLGDVGVTISSSPSPSMKSLPPEPEIVTPHSNQQEDDWGDFGTFSEPAPSGAVINQVVEDGGSSREDEKDNFRAFENFTSSNNVKPDFPDHPPEPAVEGFEDFSAFEEPGPLVSDVGEIGASSLAPALLKKYGSEFVGLPRVWKEICDAVECDMQRGIRILDYISTQLSRTDQSLVVKSDKISSHILALAEFLRIIRSIAASIGDLLGVDKSAVLQESTLSEWHLDDIIVSAAVVENLYTTLISKAVSMGILSEPPALPSVTEIRKSNGSRTTFCHLTLQAVTEDKSTRSVVLWKDKHYMACSANFCANRLPTLDIL